MLSDFLVRAALAGVGVAVISGLLGCFVVWRRMAFFGDAVAHAAVLGVAVSLSFSISIVAGVFATALVMAVLLWRLEGRGLGQDAILAVLAYGALSLGLVLAAILPSSRVDLETYLFGDVLTATRADLGVIWGCGGVLAAVVVWRWRNLVTATVNADMAHSVGIDPRREDLVLTCLLALLVAIAIKVVGALLITALLIMPAAAARRLAKTPEAMAFWAMGLGACAALGGLWAALRLDSPVGPTMVCVAAGLFAATRLVPLAR